MFAPILVTGPASGPVTLADAKAHLRVEDGAEDALISVYIAAATAYLDGWSGVLGRALVTQVWAQDFAGWDEPLRLPLAPVASITHVRWRDAADVEQTLDPATYELLSDAAGPHVRLKRNVARPPLADVARPVSVTFVAGVAAEQVPAPIRAAILMMVGDLYRNRETVSIGATASAIPMSTSVAALIAPYRRVA